MLILMSEGHLVKAWPYESVHFGRSP